MLQGSSPKKYFFFNDTATTEIYTLSLHDALPIWDRARDGRAAELVAEGQPAPATLDEPGLVERPQRRQPDTERPQRLVGRSEEHTSELQSRQYLVCRLLLEKKKKITYFVVQQSTS